MQDDDDDGSDSDDDAADDGVRCSAAALDLAVPADGTLRPLERLDGRWTCMSMPQHVNLIAYGGQFTDATWPSFGRRRRLRRCAAATSVTPATTATSVTPATTTTTATTATTAVGAAAETESPVVRAVMRAVEQAASTENYGGGGGGCGGGAGPLGFWRRFFACLRGLFRLPSLANRRVRRAPPPRFKSTTL